MKKIISVKLTCFLFFLLYGVNAYAGFFSNYAAVAEAQKKIEIEAQEKQRRALEIQRLQLELQIRQQELRRQSYEQELELKRQAQEREFQRQQQLELKAKQSEKQQFWDSVAAQEPKFFELTSDVNFQAWLNNPDPISDITRRTYMSSAIEQNNTGQAIAILNEFRYGLFLAPAPTKVIASNEQSFIAEITRLQPYWHQINNDHNFKKWLVSADPKTDISFQTYLEDAFKDMNVSRVERIYAAFLLSLPSPPSYMVSPMQSPLKQKKSISVPKKVPLL